MERIRQELKSTWKDKSRISHIEQVAKAGQRDLQLTIGMNDQVPWVWRIAALVWVIMVVETEKPGIQDSWILRKTSCLSGDGTISLVVTATTNKVVGSNAARVKKIANVFIILIWIQSFKPNSKVSNPFRRV
jgi:hypothetical protein